MKIATTIGEMYLYTENPVKSIESYEGTGFKYLDYSFYDVVRTHNHPFMSDNWKEFLKQKLLRKSLVLPLCKRMLLLVI